jgi:hypothetical protein
VTPARIAPSLLRAARTLTEELGDGMATRNDSRTDPRRNGRAPDRDDLAVRIEHHIAGKARGRVRDLQVVCTDDLIILQGRTRTQHDKQLIQEAVFDVADRRAVLANWIVVSC